MRCPISDNLTPSKRNCAGCRYFDYDESNDEGKMRVAYFCGYKEAEEGEER